MFAAFNQRDFLQAVIDEPEYYKTCVTLFMCGTVFATEVLTLFSFGLRPGAAAAARRRLR